MSKVYNFEDYLSNVFLQIITGTDEEVSDDDFEDAFDAWYEQLSADDMYRYGQRFADIKYQEGYVVAMNQALKQIRGN